MRHPKSGRQCILAVCLVLFLVGCWTTVRIDRRDWGAIPADETIRITTRDGITQTISGVTVSETHIEGATDGEGAPGRFRVSLDSVDYIEVRDFSVGRTALLTATTGTLIAVVAAFGESDVRATSSSSCPFVYSFDGTRYVLDSETFAGAVAGGLERTDVDNLEHLTSVDSRYRLLLTNERPEIQYTDVLNLLVVDHPSEARVFPDADQRPHAVTDLRPARSARGLHGGDATDAVRWEDDRYWEGAPLEGLDPSLAEELRDGLTLTFQRPESSEVLLLVRARNTELAPFALRTFLELQGDSLVSWYRRVDREEALQRRLRSWMAREGMLHVSLWIDGEWQRQDALLDVGPHLPKSQVARLDLSGLDSDTVRIRLESARGLWTFDRIALGVEADEAPEVQEIVPARAIDRYDRDHRTSLQAQDDRYYTAFPGDTVVLEYEAPQQPVAAGQTRSILLRSRGFYHLLVDQSEGRRPLVADRILDEPLYGNRFVLDRWLTSD